MVPLPEPTADDLEDACKFLEQCMDVLEESESETESEAEEPDHIYPEVEEDMEYHTSDDEIYPDEEDAEALMLIKKLEAFKKDGKYYHDGLEQQFPLFSGYAPKHHPYPNAFVQGAHIHE